jgi:hypothetical protein
VLVSQFDGGREEENWTALVGEGERDLPPIYTFANIKVGLLFNLFYSSRFRNSSLITFLLSAAA